MINILINENKTVYIFRHSYEDLDICFNIKNFFHNSTHVILITDNLNCIELENLIKQFDFIIASRYHSIIHAYKNEIPAFVIGWADKYKELLENFDQLPYLLDIREEINTDKSEKVLRYLIKNFKDDKKKIALKMTKIAKLEFV